MTIIDDISKGIDLARLGFDIAKALVNRFGGDDNVLDLRVRDLLPGPTQLELAKAQADAKAAAKFGESP